MTDATHEARPVELRNEQGHLQGKVYAGRYLEIVTRGTVTVYDVRTGSRLEAAIVRVQSAGTAHA